MTFEISYHIITVALISFRPCDVFAVAPISKYLLRLASASLLQIITDLRERRAAGDRRCGNQCSCREAPKPLDGVLFLYSPAKVGGLLGAPPDWPQLRVDERARGHRDLPALRLGDRRAIAVLKRARSLRRSPRQG